MSVSTASTPTVPRCAEPAAGRTAAAPEDGRRPPWAPRAWQFGPMIWSNVEALLGQLAVEEHAEVAPEPAKRDVRTRAQVQANNRRAIARYEAQRWERQVERKRRQNLSAADLTTLGLVALWPSWCGWITTRNGRTQVLRATVWIVGDERVERYGSAALYQKALLELPIGAWNIGYVHRGARGYYLELGSAAVRERAFDQLPAEGK